MIRTKRKTKRDSNGASFKAHKEKLTPVILRERIENFFIDRIIKLWYNRETYEHFNYNEWVQSEIDWFKIKIVQLSQREIAPLLLWGLEQQLHEGEIMLYDIMHKRSINYAGIYRKRDIGSEELLQAIETTFRDCLHYGDEVKKGV